MAHRLSCRQSFVADFRTRGRRREEFDAAAFVAAVTEESRPESAFRGLTAAQQQAVIDLLTVTSTDTTASTVEATSTEGAQAAATTSCWTFTKRYNANNYLGQTMFSYFQRINWCGSGGVISGTPYRTRWAEVYQAYWQFTGHIGNSTGGGNGYTYYSAFTQGSFANCFPGFGCVQWRYPWIDMTVYPNGYVVGSAGR
jgi:hypothetical protein